MPPKKNLRVLVHPDFLEDAVAAGYKDAEVMPPEIQEYDLIFGPSCWRVTQHLTKFIKNAKVAATNTKKRRAKKK